MFKILHLATLALLASISQAVLKAEQNDFIYELTDENFDIEVNKRNVYLVEFYTPWCKKCQELESTLSEVAEALHDHRPRGYIGRVDCSAQQELKARFKIKTFPTFKWFLSDKGDKDYTGPLTYQGFYDYSHNYLDQPSLIKYNQKCGDMAKRNYDEGERDYRQVVLFTEKSKDPDYQMYIDTATELMDFQFANIATCDNYFGAQRKKGEAGVPRGDGIYEIGKSSNWFIKFDKSKPFKDWILENFLPPVAKLSEFTNPEAINHLQLHGMAKKDYIIMWTKPLNSEVPDSFKGAAEEFKKEMIFLIPGDNDFSVEYAQKYGADIDNNQYQIDIIQDKTWKHYTFDGDAMSEQEIIAFVRDFLDGKLKNQAKSQPIPNPSHEENVKILVGKNHDREVYSGKEHFVMYYAPWCGHCKNFKPTLEQFATHVKDTDIVVAKIDMTENELKDTPIKGYPTIFWYPKDSNAARIAFEDNRSLDGVKQFVLKNSVDYKNLFPNEKLKVSTDSQDIPEKDDDAVKVLVGLNHDEIVMSPVNDALVMYYAPWCGHCKKLAPKWVELAEHVKGSNVVIGKIDMTENKLKGLTVNSYPTIYFWEANKTMVAYEGGRELQDLKDFLVQNSKQYMKAFPNAKVFVEEVTSVVSLTTQDHDQITKDPTKDVFVSYTAPWCGHCKALKPTWVQLSDHVQGTDVVVANIDSTKHKVTFPEVKGFPTIYFYPKEGEAQAYDGGRTLQDLKDYLLKNSASYKKAFPNEVREQIKRLEDQKLEEEKEKNVTVLDQNNHDEVTKDSSKDVLVMYFAPWCGHCKALKPTWNQLADHVLNTNVVVAKIDMTQNKLEAPEVKGFPTIYFYPKEGEPQAYDGGRSLQDLKDYLIKNSSAYKKAFPNEKLEEDEVTSVTILDQKNHDDVTKDPKKDVFVMYYAPWCGHCKALKPTWNQLSDYVLKSDVVIAKIDMTKNKLESPEVKGFPTIFFYPKEGEPQAYDGGRTLQDLKDYLIKNSSAYKKAFPNEKLEEEEETSVIVLDQKNHDQVTSDPTKDVFVMYYAPWCGHCKKLKPVWIQLSDYTQNTDVVVAKIDMTKNKLEAPEVKGFPTIFFYPKEGEPQAYDGGRTLQDLKDYLIKNSSAYKKAFPNEKLEEEEVTSVTVLDQKNHDDVTKDPKKDVFVMYYAPWCGHCKQLKPTWVKLSDYVQNTDIVIAKIDMTKNKLTQPEVKGFPTIYFYPKEGEAVSYDGGRQLQDLKDFLIKNSSAYKAAFPNEKLEEEEVTSVTVLDQKNHDEVTKNPAKDVFVMYYAPWCGHCKALKPTWIQLSDYVQNTDVVIAKIDMTKNKLVEPQVKGFPTIYFYPQEGESQAYEGGRSLQDLKDYLIINSSAYRKAFPNEKGPALKQEVIESAVTEIIGAQSHTQLTEDPTKDVFVLYYAPWCGHCKKLKPIWEELASHVLGSDIVVAQIDLTEHNLKTPDVEGYPTMYFYPKQGESKKYDGGRLLSDLKKYLFDNSELYREAFPEEEVKAQVKKTKSQEPQPDDEHIKVLVASNHNEAVYDKSKDSLVMYFAPWCGHCKKLAPVWKDLAKEMKDSNVVIAKIDMTENEIESLKITGFPTIYFYPAGGEKVQFDGQRDLNKIMGWLNSKSEQFKQAFPDWKPVVKTEKVPEKDELPPIKSIVGSNHNEIVNDPTKDVIVMYMASWCGHCKKLKPTWQQLAESLQGTNILVSMIDASLNDQDLVTVTGFPTIYWFKSDNKKPVKFEGDRSLEGIQKWISERMTDKTITFGVEQVEEIPAATEPEAESEAKTQEEFKMTDEQKFKVDQAKEIMKEKMGQKKPEGHPKNPEGAKATKETMQKMKKGLENLKNGDLDDLKDMTPEQAEQAGKMKEKMQKMMKDKQQKDDL